MPLRPLYGHEAIRDRLAGAFTSGRLPQVLLFEGPRGVGKQRLALWLAQRVLCSEAPAGQREPCGACQACRMVADLAHPDLHWIVPLELARKGADADKQIELVAEALADEMAARRASPLYAPPGGMASHGIAAARLLLRRLVLTPALASRKVFIVGNAERLIPQLANPEAANALLKSLEEPPADAVIMLTTTDPEALLPTILSRVVRVKVPRVKDSVVAAFAQNEMGNQNPDIATAAGCIGTLVASADPIGGTAEAARAFLRASERPLADRYALALRQAPFQARGAFTGMLDALLHHLRAEARTGRDTRKVVEAIACVLEARSAAQGNVNPQLLTAVLAEDLGALQ